MSDKPNKFGCPTVSEDEQKVAAKALHQYHYGLFSEQGALNIAYKMLQAVRGAHFEEKRKETASQEPAPTPAPVAWMVRRYDNDGSWIDTSLHLSKPDIKSTAKTDFIPLHAAPSEPVDVDAVIERCAKIADEHAKAWGPAMGSPAMVIAAAIRSLKANPTGILADGPIPPEGGDE